MKKPILILLLAFSFGGAQAQDFFRRIVWDADFSIRFDNRESQSSLLDSETFFSYKFIPQIGMYTATGGHSIFAGGSGSLIRDMGARDKDQPDSEFFMYYHRNGDILDAYAGAFPRMYMTELPAEFFDLKLSFYDPVIEGVLLRYDFRRFYFELVGDWYSKKSATRREQFILYSSGRWDLQSKADRWFSAGYYATVQHFAASEAEPGVVDNFLFKPWVGFDDRFVGVGVAWLQSLQRDRLHGDGWDLPNGFCADIRLRWRSLGVCNSVYFGDDLMPYWDRYGNELYKGDPFFRTTHGVYNRLEFHYEPQLGDDVSLRIGSIHHYDGASWSWQQLATLSIRLGGGHRANH